MLEEAKQFLFGRKIEKIEPDKIEPNELNPRKVFDEESDDRLLQSISEEGIIVPLIVYYDSTKRKYFLIDGERRLRCAKKLQLPTVLAYVLEKRPTALENVLLMFHVHMVRKDWSDIATAFAIREIKEQLGTDDVDEISKYTNLKPYKVRKYLKLLDYPKPILDKFLKSEAGSETDKLDTDILIELSRPMRLLKELYPDIFQKLGEEKIVNIIIKKKKNGSIINNREIRQLSKIMQADKKVNVSRNKIASTIESFFESDEASLSELYDATVATSYELVKFGNTIEKIKEDLESSLSVKKMTDKEFDGLIDNLTRFRQFLDSKIHNMKKMRSV